MNKSLHVENGSEQSYSLFYFKNIFCIYYCNFQFIFNIGHIIIFNTYLNLKHIFGFKAENFINFHLPINLLNLDADNSKLYRILTKTKLV